MLVVIDPYPTVSAVMQDRTDGVYLLPACTQFETRGSVTASNRSLQWREKTIEPVFESLPDHTIMRNLPKSSVSMTGCSATLRLTRGVSRTLRTSPASSIAACGRSDIPARA